MRKRRAGFSLIEVSIALGILAFGLLMVAVMGAVVLAKRRPPEQEDGEP